MSWRPNHWIERCLIFLISSPSSGNVENAARAERALFARQPAHQRRDLVDLDKARHWNLGQHVLDVLARHLVEDRGFSGRWGDAVDQHAALRELLAQRLG